MAPITVGLWNIEWMNDLFTGDPPRFKPGGDKVRGPRANNTVSQRRANIGGVLNELDASVWLVVEGPNRADELELFFNGGDVAGQWRCAVQPSGAQSIGLAVRVDRGEFADPPFRQFDAGSATDAPELKAATDPFQMDTDQDGLVEVHKFERRPLYVEVVQAGGRPFRILGVHLKSKGVFDSLEWSQWWARAEGNRKKLLAQCYHLRTEFLDRYLSDPATAAIPLLVGGDINDGPGFDTGEMKLQSSGVERLMGVIWEPDLALGNAVYDALTPKQRKLLDFTDVYSVSFKDPIFDDTYQRAWIDHLLYSRARPGWVRDGRIRGVMPDGAPIYRKYPAASDHYPITCTVNLE